MINLPWKLPENPKNQAAKATHISHCHTYVKKPTASFSLKMATIMLAETSEYIHLPNIA